MTKAKQPEAPKHLRADSRKWFSAVVNTYELTDAELRLLRLACEAWDRTQQAREALAKHGLVITDRYGQARPRPEVAIERDSRAAFARLVAQLALPDEEPKPDMRYQSSRQRARRHG